MCKLDPYCLGVSDVLGLVTLFVAGPGTYLLTIVPSKSVKKMNFGCVFNAGRSALAAMSKCVGFRVSRL